MVTVPRGHTGGPFRHPGRAIGLGFASAIASGTLLLSLPVARSEGSRAPLLDAAFTATSAVCVTGLIVVDTETYWSTFGQVVILILIQLGGLGLMTVATLLAILFARRLGLQARLLAQAETKAVTAADLRRVVRNIVLFTLVTEAIAATVLAVRFMITYGESPAHALWSGVFHAVSAFNNAGFSLYADSLMRYVTDPWVQRRRRLRGGHRRTRLSGDLRAGPVLAAATNLERGHPDHRDRQRESAGPRHVGHLGGGVRQRGHARGARRRRPAAGRAVRQHGGAHRAASTPSTSQPSPPRACSRWTC